VWIWALVLGQCWPFQAALVSHLWSSYNINLHNSYLSKPLEPSPASLEPLNVSSIGNALGKFYCCSPKSTNFYKTSYPRICVEMDFIKGFPTEINLKALDCMWVQNLDYENVSFRCRACYETRHVIKNFPKHLQNHIV